MTAPEQPNAPPIATREEVIVDGLAWVRDRTRGNWHSEIHGRVAIDEGTSEEFHAALDRIAALVAECDRLREALAHVEALARRGASADEIAVACGTALIDSARAAQGGGNA